MFYCQARLNLSPWLTARTDLNATNHNIRYEVLKCSHHKIVPGLCLVAFINGMTKLKTNSRRQALMMSFFVICQHDSKKDPHSRSKTFLKISFFSSRESCHILLWLLCYTFFLPLRHFVLCLVVCHPQQSSVLSMEIFSMPLKDCLILV